MLSKLYTAVTGTLEVLICTAFFAGGIIGVFVVLGSMLRMVAEVL